MSRASRGVPQGWVQYIVDVDVPPTPGYDGDDAALSFQVTAAVVPRVGELLEFDGPGNGLALTVTAVEHYFSISKDTPHPHSSIVVSTEIASPISVRIAQKLFEDSAEMRRWIDQFPTMEPNPPPRPGIPCAECGEGAYVNAVEN